MIIYEENKKEEKQEKEEFTGPFVNEDGSLKKGRFFVVLLIVLGFGFYGVYNIFSTAEDSQAELDSFLNDFNSKGELVANVSFPEDMMMDSAELYQEQLKAVLLQKKLQELDSLESIMIDSLDCGCVDVIPSTK